MQQNTKDISLEVIAREDQGTSSTKKMRREQDLIPGVVYGGDKSPQLISIVDKILRKASESESFFSQIINLQLNGSTERVVLKELQRHPYRPFFIHADFQRVREDVKINISIPIHFINTDNCIGVKQQGGAISYDLTEIAISCLPKDLPASIEIDLAELELNQVIHISEIALPEGVESVALQQDAENDLSVVKVIMPRIVEEEEDELLDATEQEEGEEAEEAAGEQEEKEEEK